MKDQEESKYDDELKEDDGSSDLLRTRDSASVMHIIFDDAVATADAGVDDAIHDIRESSCISGSSGTEERTSFAE